MKDKRIAYGAGCTWWDSIQKVSVQAAGLPCCPECRGLLFEMESIDAWFGQVDRHEIEAPEPGYRGLVEWLRGRCFPSYTIARAAYDQAQQGAPA